MSIPYIPSIQGIHAKTSQLILFNYVRQIPIDLQLY